MCTNFEYKDCKNKRYTSCSFSWHDLIQIKTPKMGVQNFFDLRSILVTFYLFKNAIHVIDLLTTERVSVCVCVCGGGGVTLIHVAKKFTLLF